MCKNHNMGKISKNYTLKQKIMTLLILGWVIPVLVMTTLIATYVDRKTDEMVQQTVSSSLEKAEEIFELEMVACETASKNASYYSGIRESYLKYIIDSDERSFEDKVNKFIKSEYKYNSLIKTAVLNIPKTKFMFYTYNNSAGASYKNVEYYINNVNEDVASITKELGTKTTLYTSGGNLYMLRNLVRSNYEQFASLALEINENSLVDGFSSVWGYSDAVVLLDGEYMMGNQKILDEEPSLANANNSFVRSFRKSYAIRKKNYYGKNITAIIELDNSIIFNKVYGTWLIFGLIIIVMIPLTIVIFRFFNRNVVAPIDVMMEGYDEIANKNYGYRIKGLSNSSKEFFYMQQSFNDMSMQIKEQFEKIYKEEIALRDAQIMALQSQINPHFLNNTFEIINWEARLNGNIKVSKMIEALSTMLEATMNRHGKHMHMLSEELTYVDAYAYIISERLGERFKYVKEIDESLLDIQVPKLIVQPIVENAVEHGLGKVQRGDVSLRLYKDDDFVIIEIKNDGAMDEEDQKKVKRILSESIDPEKERSLSLGIRNVNNRLKLIYGEDCGLFMHNQEDKYTISILKLKTEEIIRA